MVKILLVEDETGVREMLIDELKDQGHEVIEAVNGEDGLNKLLASDGVDIILCDRAMAVMSGYKLLEILRDEHKQFDKIPFVFITALTDPRDRESVDHLNPAAYIDKPVDFSILEEQIKKLTSK